MKNRFILSLGVLMVFFYTCSKDSDLLTGPADDSALKSAHARVFVVQPGTGDDTQALLDAFELAKAAGPGSTVQLKEATYSIRMIAIHDFYGNFRGKGRNATIVTNEENLDCGSAWDNNEITAFIKFVNGNVTISDMKFKLRDGKPCAFSESNEAWSGDLYSLLSFADWGATHHVTGSNMIATVKRVDFEGGSDGGYGSWWKTDHNTLIGIWISPDILIPGSDFEFGTGQYLIEDCAFYYFLDASESQGLDEETRVVYRNNHFDRCYGQLYVSTLAGSKIEICQNYFTGADVMDVWLDDLYWGFDFPPVKHTEYIVTGNRFDSPAGVTSVFMQDAMRVTHADDAYSLVNRVCFNVFKNHEGGTAIVGLNNKDAVIWNNIFTGTGVCGINLEGDEQSGIYALNANIVGNNFRNAEYEGPDIYLGYFTKNCKVLGSPHDVVTDNGVGNQVFSVRSCKKGPRLFTQPDAIQKRNEAMIKAGAMRSHTLK